jgi:diguanylate cyclase (GGDEF)-like protein
LRQSQAEDFFLAGLLQDVGMLALDRAVPDLYRNTEEMQRNHRAICEHEKRRLQCDHADIGARAMRTWNLPERLCRAIGNSHKIDLAISTDPGEIMDRCVALSGPVADLFLAKPDKRQFAETALAIERSIGLDKTAFGQVIGSISAIIPETEAIFDATLLSKQDAELMLDQAREVLMIRSLQALRDINTLKVVAERSYSRAMDLEEETRRDALTGVYNRAYLDQFLTREFDNSIRQHWPLSIAFADLDNFKAINDNFGHQAGDRILQTTARILRDNTRETDLIARYGGEEFVSCCRRRMPKRRTASASASSARFTTRRTRSARRTPGSRSRSAAPRTLRSTNSPMPPS